MVYIFDWWETGVLPGAKYHKELWLLCTTSRGKRTSEIHRVHEDVFWCIHRKWVTIKITAQGQSKRGLRQLGGVDLNYTTRQAVQITGKVLAKEIET